MQEYRVLLMNYHSPNEEGVHVRLLSEVNSILDKINLFLSPFNLDMARCLEGGDSNLYLDIVHEQMVPTLN